MSKKYIRKAGLFGWLEGPEYVIEEPDSVPAYDDDDDDYDNDDFPPDWYLERIAMPGAWVCGFFGFAMGGLCGFAFGGVGGAIVFAIIGGILGFVAGLLFLASLPFLLSLVIVIGVVIAFIFTIALLWGVGLPDKDPVTRQKPPQTSPHEEDVPSENDSTDPEVQVSDSRDNKTSKEPRPSAHQQGQPAPDVAQPSTSSTERSNEPRFDPPLAPGLPRYRAVEYGRVTRVMIDVETLPKNGVLATIAARLDAKVAWFYLPGMDSRGPAYAVVTRRSGERATIRIFPDRLPSKYRALGPRSR